MNSDLQKELDGAVEQFVGTVGALSKIQSINDSMLATMDELHSCEEKMLSSCKTIEGSAQNVNEQAASFSESNEALRISLGKDVRDLTEKVSSYAATTSITLNDLRVQETSNTREIREAISDLKAAITNMESSVNNGIKTIQNLLEESKVDHAKNRKILLVVAGFAAAGMLLSLVGLFI